ncbi:MAG: ATPase [Bacteroidales bacterium]|nr:ATPase [Bacteroidales bacterium]
MRLIVDAGSTKAHWQVIDDNRQVQQVYTDGINLLVHSWEHIEKQICTALSEAGGDSNIEAMEIYAAGGIKGELRDAFKRKISQRFGVSEENIVVESDLVLAAKALCGEEAGIACILGTGSNSCLWDGKQIVKNVRPLGYILGDEGSGAVLGKKLVADWFKGLLSEDISGKLSQYVGLEYADVMGKIYREPGGNKYLASLTKFMRDNIEAKEIRDIVMQSFDEFVVRNLMQYEGAEKLKVNFVGSIAYYFKDQLVDVLKNRGFAVGIIRKEPLE